MDRFWSKVDVQGPDDCWEWQASLRTDGGGQFAVDGRYKLDSEQVLAIKEDDRSQSQIAADFGITQSHVSRIKSGEDRSVYQHRYHELRS